MISAQGSECQSHEFKHAWVNGVSSYDSLKVGVPGVGGESSVSRDVRTRGIRLLITAMASEGVGAKCDFCPEL